MKRNIIRIALLSILMFVIIFSNNQYAVNKIMLGDINKDGVVDSRDQLLIMRHIMASTRKKHPEWILTGEELKIADVTQNEKINNSDTLAILRYIAAKRNPEKIGSKHKEWLELGEIGIESIAKPTPEHELIPEIKKIEVEQIILNKTSVDMDLSSTNKTVLLEATIKPDNASDKTITWSSSNDKIATVDNNGKVTLKGNGTVSIIAKSNNEKFAKCTIKITTSPTGIKFNNTSLNLDLTNNKTGSLKATVEPSTAINKKITWTSSNTKVATVDKNGKVTGKAKGSATITAKTSNNKKATYKVNVTLFSQEYTEHMRQKIIYYGSQTDYGCIIDTDLCRLTIFKKVNNKWTMIKEWNAIVGVNRPGLGYEDGTSWNHVPGPRSCSFKTVTKVYGKWTNEPCTCYVQHKHSSAGYSGGDNCQRFESATKNGRKNPDDYSAKNRYLSHGCCNLSTSAAKWIWNNVPINSTVIIFDKYNPMPKWNVRDTDTTDTSIKSLDVPKKVNISKSTLELNVGENKKLSASVTPTKSTHKGYTWRSSNKKVATVDKGGKVTAKGKGTAIIKVKVLGMTAQCKVTVK